MIRNKIGRFIAAAFLMAGIACTSKHASAYTQGACRADGKLLCPGMTEQEMTPCLRKHQAELSKACQDNLAEMRRVVKDLYASCQPDIEKYCADVPHGGGRIRKCLRSHEADLTADCKAEIAGARERYKSIIPAQQTLIPTVTTSTTTISTTTTPAVPALK